MQYLWPAEAEVLVSEVMGWFKSVMGVGSSEPEPPKRTESNFVFCCDEPSLIPTWEGSKYGLKCTNCKSFEET